MNQAPVKLFTVTADALSRCLPAFGNEPITLRYLPPGQAVGLSPHKLNPVKIAFVLIENDGGGIATGTPADGGVNEWSASFPSAALRDFVQQHLANGTLVFEFVQKSATEYDILAKG